MNIQKKFFRVGMQLRLAVIVGFMATTAWVAQAGDGAFLFKVSADGNNFDWANYTFVNQSEYVVTAIRVQGTIHYFGAGDGYGFNIPVGQGVDPGGKAEIKRVDSNTQTYADVRQDILGSSTESVRLVITATFQVGNNISRQVSFRLPKVGSTSDNLYVFESPGMTREMTVSSLIEAGNGGTAESVPFCDLIIKTSEGTVRTTIDSIGAAQTIVVTDGETVEVSVPDAVYYKLIGSNYVAMTEAELSTLEDNAQKRYVARSISVNNVAQSGDPTLYRFTVQEDVNISARWDKEFAVRVINDLQKTGWVGTGTQADPYLPTLDTPSLGDPEPATGLSWYSEATSISPTIAPSKSSFAKPGLDIRYIVDNFTKRDFGGSWVTQDVDFPDPVTDAKVGPGEFTVSGPVEITYRWKRQFGVTVQADSTERETSPRVIVGTTTNDGTRTVWCDPGTNVVVAVEKAPTAQDQVQGWINGDGYYFVSQEDLDNRFALSNFTPPAGAIWDPSYSNSHAGMTISALQRPVRVMWRFGSGKVVINTTIGAPGIVVGNYLGSINPTLMDTDPNITKISVNGTYPSPGIADADMAFWDSADQRLHPLVPGSFEATWTDGTTTFRMEVNVAWTVHYPHISNAPAVSLNTPDFSFNKLVCSESGASVNDQSHFTASGTGRSVLWFNKPDASRGGAGRLVPVIKVVETKVWNAPSVLQPRSTDRLIGSAIRDSALDKAKLGTGYIVHSNANYNVNVYQADKLTGLGVADVYDLTELNARNLVVTKPENLPGPVIAVNKATAGDNKATVTIGWYASPVQNNGLLWPYAVREYEPQWPTATTGLGRIVIASQYGSESVTTSGQDQLVVYGATNITGNITNIWPVATTFDPSRLQQTRIYNQPDRTLAGYNPNEEHALIAPSLRFAHVSPRPPAVYALRTGDLNVTTGSGYTSEPYVLAQFYDVAEETFKMKVYAVVKEDATYSFADASLWTPGKTLVAMQLHFQPHVTMEAGEPVIPFYPLGEVAGAVIPPETYGTNLMSQLTYWEDHKGSNWSVSGGKDAWFSVSPFYPLLPDFWWPDGQNGVFKNGTARVPNVGDSLAFLPASLTAAGNKPTEILYKSEWPEIAPVLKAGETLTFPGGEYRQDHPTQQTLDDQGNFVTVETPGLPGIVAFAAAEVVFDSLDPTPTDNSCRTTWTARAAQVLEKRAVSLPSLDFPKTLSPASGRVRISQGKYIFNELPASLQKRVRYDSTNGKLEVFGLLNDKAIGDSTLTASPPQVYVLEPNILTAQEVASLKALDTSSKWTAAIDALYAVTQNPSKIGGASGYLVGLQQRIQRTADGTPITMTDTNSGIITVQTDVNVAEPLQAQGPGLALLPNADFLDPANTNLPEVSWITLVENNDPSLGGSPVTPHVIKVDRRERYRGAIKTVLSDNVFDENVVLRHQGDFGAHADRLVFEWWYRPDDGSLNVPPPDLIPAGQTNPWKLFPDLTGKQGQGRQQVLLKGDPQAPEALLADTWWFCRYRHVNDAPKVNGVDWSNKDNTLDKKPVNFTWAGAGNSDPFNDMDLDGIMDFRAQLAMGWIKRVLDAVNPYEARIRDFEGDSPSTVASMIQQFGARFEGPVALNPAKNVIENVGLIELYETVLKRGRDLSIDLSRPVSTPAIANALQLASTRLSDFYMLLANEAYSDAQDPTIGFGSSSVEYGHLAPAVFTFQNQMDSVLDEELALLRGVDDYFAKPVYNRLFWNFTKGEGEAAYAVNYALSDINADGFIDEDDAMILYPQGHGDAWGHYLTALRYQYKLLNHPYFNWVSRSEFYNLMDVVIKVDFLDERKFAATAAAKAKAGAEIVDQTYREKYVEDPTAQWQGYTDSNPDRAWGVQGWARRAGQGAYFDWVTANAILPSEHPNSTLEGIQKVDRQSNGDIAVISANLNAIQGTFDDANSGYNPLGIGTDTVVFDVDPARYEVGTPIAASHFEQIYERALGALENAKALWDHANESDNRVRKIANDEAAFRNSVYQEDLAYKNRLIELFGKPYEGTIGSGKLYPAGYDGPDLALYMYINKQSREITNDTVPGPTASFAQFNSSGTLTGGDIYAGFNTNKYGKRALSLSDGWRALYAPTFADGTSGSIAKAKDGWYNVNYTDLSSPKVGLEGLTNAMPVTAAGYTFEAPDSWGNRLAHGELQSTLQQMIIQEARVAEAIAAWDGLSGEIVRTLRIVDARIATAVETRNRTELVEDVEFFTELAIDAIKLIKKTITETAQLAEYSIEAGEEAVPKNLPTGGFSISPGDALSAVRAGLQIGKVGVSTAKKIGITALDIAALAKEHGMKRFELEMTRDNRDAEGALNRQEWLKEIEDLVGDEPILRVTVFKEIEALRELSNKYRRLLDEGARLVDERAAYNKRVAAKTQMNRYQDMTFRVSRNHALRNYRSAFDLAAQYAYLAAKAYDYETCFVEGHAGSPRSVLQGIVKARSIGLVEYGEAQLGAGGLAENMAWLKANYENLKGQLGFNNPQYETGKMSLRTELFRINSDAAWKQQLKASIVEDLWDVPEFRRMCRPFDALGTQAEPGLVIRFSSDIQAGENFFGHPLSGSDHAYDPSVFATKIRASGVWFSDYQSTDLSTDLPEAPRVYLLPAGADVMGYADSGDPTLKREWTVFDQRIPVPLPAVDSELDYTDWAPVYDTLSGQYGEQRRFSSFRAYHDGSDVVNEDELVYNSRLVGRSVRNTQWVLIIPGRTFNSDANEGLDRFINQVSDIKLLFKTYGFSGN